MGWGECTVGMVEPGSVWENEAQHRNRGGFLS